MALSAALKNKLLDVWETTFLRTAEIKNDSGSWVSFSDRDPDFSQIKLSTQGRRNLIVTSASKVLLNNEDRYFDYMDDPGNATTIALFGALATGFSSGLEGKPVRLGARFRLNNGTWEQAYLGVYMIEDIITDDDSGRAELKLTADVALLEKAGTDNITDGEGPYENRPVSYLILEILKKIYPSGVSGNFEVPGKTYLSTADGEPAFSHFGKPPEKDSTGRYRTDESSPPMAFYYHPDNGKFYFGIDHKVWILDPTTEVFTASGGAFSPGQTVRGFFRMSATRIFVVAWGYVFSQRYQTLATGNILTTSDSLTTNDPGYNLAFVSGEFVVRDTNVGGGLSGAGCVGFIKNYPDGGGSGIPYPYSYAYGVNMPVPIPHYIAAALDNGTYVENFGHPATGLRTEVAVADWTKFSPSDNPQGITVLVSGFMAYNSSFGASGDRPGLQVFWGMKSNLAWADDLANWTGPFLFATHSAGGDSVFGVNNTGTIDIYVYYGYSGTRVKVTQTAFSGASTPIYDLRFFSDGTDDWLFWVEIDWMEIYKASGDAASVTTIQGHIKKGELSDSGGYPYLADADKSTLWSGGDNLFMTPDDDLLPIAVVPFRRSSSTEFIVVMMDPADIGADAFKLYYVDSAWTTVIELGSGYYGWGNFTVDAANDKIYAIERDTGRVILIDISSAPSSYSYVSGGAEPVPQSYFECPNSVGIIPITQSSKECLYGVNFPWIPPFTQEEQVAPLGKYYFWKYHPELTDRVPLFDPTRDNALDALALLAEVIGYAVGLDPDGTGFIRPLPSSSSSEEFTIDADSAIGRHFQIKKAGGYDDIINRSTFIPYDSVSKEPEANLSLQGYIGEDGENFVFNGETMVRSITNVEKDITLHCISAGAIGTAEFKYLVADYQVQTALRSDVNPATLDEIDLDNNNGVVAGMLAKVADFEGVDPSTAPLSVASVASDGTITLSEDLDEAYAQGTLVVFYAAESGAWSDEYSSPDTFTTGDTWVEIGSTGLFLKFVEDDSDPIGFSVGDRIHVYNPGLVLQSSTTQKFKKENQISIDERGPRESNFDNPYLSLAVGMERTRRLVDDNAFPRHRFNCACPLFLQATPLSVIKIKGEKILPVSTDNEEKCYVETVVHDFKNGTTTLELKGVLTYR